MVLLLSVAMFLLFVLVIRLQHRSYVNEATRMVYEIKAEALKSNVMEIVQDIQRFRDWEIQRDREELRAFGTQIAGEEGSIEELLLSPGYGSWLINGYRFYVWDEGEEALVYAGTPMEADSLQDLKDRLKEELEATATFHKGDQTVICGIPGVMVDFRTKQYIYTKIHALRFEDGSYIWVNEVLDYAGGEDYAVRRIHPNLPDTEGMLLSTETRDVRGNYPYREELEGINADGECFHTYYFEEFNSDEVSEKYTYSYLYRPYNWIISMGSYTSDIESYRAKLRQESTWIMTGGILAMGLLLAALLFTERRMILRSEQERFGREREQLERVSIVDPLTGAVNRRGAQPRLTELLERRKKDGLRSTVVMIDIDDFKHINDTHGHETGDKVLVSLSGAIRRSFRAGDLLIRWGGDEFLLAVRGLGPEGEELLRRKLYHAADSAAIQAGDETVLVRISSGATEFHPEDESFMDAVNRADRALYQAKRGGKGVMYTEW